MASLTLTSGSRVGQPLVVTGEDFETETPVTIEVVSPSGDSLRVNVVSDVAGTITSQDAFAFSSSHDGVCTVTADDGTNRVSESAQIYS